MPKYVCPSCGAPFNGKKCKNCAYESFSEEIAHNLHVHKGEPLVIHNTARKPLPYQDPFDCPNPPKKHTKKSGGGLKKLFLIGVILALIYLVGMPLFYLPSLWHEFNASSAEVSSDTVPLDAVTLYRDDILSIYGSIAGEDLFGSEIPFYITNHSGTEYFVQAENVLVNGICLDAFADFFGYIAPGETRCIYLTFLEPGLEYAGISRIDQLSLLFRYQYSDYQGDTPFFSDPVYTKPIVLGQTGTETMSQPVPDFGEPVLQENGLRLYYLGRYPEDTEDPGDSELIFCVENTDTRDTQLYSQEVFVNGTNSTLALWANAPGSCISIFPMYLDTVNLDSIDQLQELTIHLSAYDGQSGADLGSVVIPVE